MADNEIRIHPEITEPQRDPEERVRFCDVELARMQFHNPYSSREEYEFREQRFINEQLDLLAPIGITPEMVAKANHDLTSLETPPTGLFYLLGPEQVLHWTLGERVFGELMRSRSDVRFYKEDDKEASRELMAQEYLFQQGQLFMTSGEVRDNDSGLLIARTLKRDKLTPEEMQECAQRAFDLYDVLEFSNIHYAKINRGNPLQHFLGNIVEVGAKLDFSRFSEHTHEGEVYGWFEGNGYIPSGLSVQNPREPEYYLIIENCIKELHKDLIRKGDRARYTVNPLGPHDWHYRGKLIDLVGNDHDN